MLAIALAIAVIAFILLHPGDEEEPAPAGNA